MQLLTQLRGRSRGPSPAADLVGRGDPYLTLKLYAHSRAEQRKATLLRAASGFDKLLVGVKQGYDEDEE